MKGPAPRRSIVRRYAGRVKRIYRQLTARLKARRARRKHRPAARDALHAFWRNPTAENAPERYLAKGPERSQYLAELLAQHASHDESVLELGCNVGRNLDFLRGAGWTDLAGIEINPTALELLRSSFPELAESATLFEGALENALPGFEDQRFDVVFTMAVLEHVHDDSAWLFGHIERVTRKCLITIEDERRTSERHFPRNYRRIFERLGLRQVFESDALPDLPRGFVARVLVKEQGR